MSDYSWKELMAVVFSREIKDTDKITSGAHTEIFFAATMLAQKTHAPNMKLQLGGGVTLCNVVDIDMQELPKTSTGYDLIRYAESVHDHPDTYLFYGAPGGTKYYKEGSEFRDVNHFWFADKFFVGGIQVDKWGNTNMIGLRQGRAKSTFRGPGTIGINDIAVGVRDTYAFITAHDKRRLVEKVDYISHPARRSAATTSSTAVARSGSSHRNASSTSTPIRSKRGWPAFPGCTVDNVKANTGFEVKVRQEGGNGRRRSRSRNWKHCAT